MRSRQINHSVLHELAQLSRAEYLRMLLAVGHEELVLYALHQRLEKLGVGFACPIAQGRLDQRVSFLDFMVQLGHNGLQFLIFASLALEAQLDVIIGLEDDIVPVPVAGERDALAKLWIFHGASDFSEGGLTDEPEWWECYLGMGEYSCVDFLERGLEELGLEAILELFSSQMLSMMLLSFIFFWLSSPMSRFFSSFSMLILKASSLFSFLKLSFSVSISLAIFSASLISCFTWQYSSSDNFLLFFISTSVFSSISLILLLIIDSISLQRFSSTCSELLLNFSIQFTSLFQISWPQLSWPFIMAMWLSYFSRSRLNSLQMQRLLLLQSASCRYASSRLSISSRSMDSRLEMTLRLSCVKMTELVVLVVVRAKGKSAVCRINKIIVLIKQTIDSFGRPSKYRSNVKYQTATDNLRFKINKYSCLFCSEYCQKNVEQLCQEERIKEKQ